MFKFSDIRRARAQAYVDTLRNLQGLALLDINYSELAPHIFPVRILNGQRNRVFDILIDAGIECGIHYQPNHLLSYYRSDYSLTNTECLSGELLSLPLHPDLTEPDQLIVINTFKYALEAGYA